MKHHFLETCQSTQSSFKEFWAQHDMSDPHLLISADKQLAGFGRRGSEWYTNDSSLTMSFSIKAQSELSLTPLQIALCLVKFFEAKNIELKVKWPNDLINSDGEKVAGILCQVLNSNYVLVGLGLNSYFDSNDLEEVKKFSYPVGHLNLINSNKKELAQNIYQTVIDAEDFSHQEWNHHCFHSNKIVKIIDGDQSISGQFLGIDSTGAALIQTAKSIKKVFTGSLRISS